MKLYGMDIIESPFISPVPNMQVSAEFQRLQSPKLVAETNAWMREFFGTHTPVYIIDTKALGLDMFGYGGKVIAMSPQHAAVLREM